MMTYYTGNVTASQVGLLPGPYYWYSGLFEFVAELSFTDAPVVQVGSWRNVGRPRGLLVLHE